MLSQAVELTVGQTLLVIAAAVGWAFAISWFVRAIRKLWRDSL